MDDGLLKATEYSLDDLTIVSSAGVMVKLNQVMRELNIFEDLFGNAMSGSVFLSDSQNLINILPIVGAEYLTITLTKPSTPWKLQKVFRVYKISDRKKSSNASEDYVLHFCSEEMLLSESTKISKAYKGMTISQIIKDITATYLSIPSSKFPDRALAPTTDTIDVVIPYWSPFFTINWLSRMARTGSTPGCSFVFYEDGEGFHFTSIETLSQQAPLQTINFMPMNFEGSEKEKHDKTDMEIRHESAEGYELIGAPDTLRQVSTGMYAGRLIRVNPFQQRINISTMNAAVLFNTTKHVNKYSFIQENKDRNFHPQTEQFDAYFRVAADHLNVETWMLQRSAYMAGLHGYQLKVVAPGNMNFRVGQVITLNMPASTSPTQDKKPLDDIFTGKYLITAIRHKVDRTKYMCILELSKDSLVTSLPMSIEGNPKLNELRKS